jgi:hypothetical protein
MVVNEIHGHIGNTWKPNKNRELHLLASVPSSKTSKASHKTHTSSQEFEGSMRQFIILEQFDVVHFLHDPLACCITFLLYRIMQDAHLTNNLLIVEAMETYKKQ